jgi:hypothetical protein
MWKEVAVALFGVPARHLPGGIREKKLILGYQGSERRSEPHICRYVPPRLGRSVWCTSASYAKDGRFESRSGNWVS